VKIRSILEEERAGSERSRAEMLVHPEWEAEWPWLVQGTTTRAHDFALDSPAVLEAWSWLSATTGCSAAVHARQPHGAAVGVRTPDGPGLHVVADADGHLSRAAGAVLGVTTADCVPVTLVHPESRAVGMVHAGWRGAAARILEAAIDTLGDAFGASADELHLHFGPSICYDCYEVGPEVHAALGLPEPSRPAPVDLAGALADRAVGAGVHGDAITRSAWCTRCTGREILYSHRGGDTGRQVGFVGLRPAFP